MKWVQTAWPLVRDILLTCAGLAIIISQVGEKDPSSALIVAGLAFTVPAAATHAAGVLSGSPDTRHGPPSSSESLPPASSSHSSPPAGGTGEGGGAV